MGKYLVKAFYGEWISVCEMETDDPYAALMQAKEILYSQLMDEEGSYKSEDDIMMIVDACMLKLEELRE